MTRVDATVKITVYELDGQEVVSDRPRWRWSVTDRPSKGQEIAEWIEEHAALTVVHEAWCGDVFEGRVERPGIDKPAVAARIDAALAERERTAVMRHVLSQPPCPKCGAGVISECYGCRLAERDKQIAELTDSKDAAWSAVEAARARLGYEPPCACMLDAQDDVCAHHSPAVEKRDKRIAELEDLTTTAQQEALRCAALLTESSAVKGPGLYEGIGALLKRIAELEEALRGMLELFGNYGFADESPCVRDREIIVLAERVLAKSKAEPAQEAK